MLRRTCCDGVERERPPIPTVTTPCTSGPITALLDENACVAWRYEHTVMGRILGKERAAIAWSVLAGGPYANVKVFFIGAPITVWMVVTILYLFHVLHDSRVYAPFMMYAFSVVVASGLAFFDLRIVRRIIPTGFFLSNVGLSFVSLVSVANMWNFDDRLWLGAVLL